MSQPKAKSGAPKVSRTFVYLVIGMVILAAWALAPAPKPRKSTGIPPLPGGSRRAANDAFTPEDYTAKFGVVTESPRDVFRPLVVPTSAASSLVAMSPELVPAGIAGGESNWAYTGTAIIDGVPVALIENRQTLDGAFLKQGEGWKGAIVAAITPDTVTLVGASGRAVTLRLPMPSFDENGAPSGPSSPGISPMGGSPVRPLDPRLSGPIGEISVSPAATADVSPGRPLARREVR